MRDDRDRGKPTWRERDASRGKPREQRSSPAEEKSQQGYRAQLEKLFASGGISKLVADHEKAQADGKRKATDAPVAPVAAAPAPEPEAPAAPKSRKRKPPEGELTRADLLLRTHNAVGRDAITAAVEGYLAKHPWPDDFEMLAQALEHRSDARIAEALGALDKLLDRQKPRRERALVARLRSLDETSGDPELRAQAAVILKKLS